jgi:hypothetical protein
MAAKDINLVIGMPSHRGLAATATLSMLLQLGKLLKARDIKSFFHNIDHAEVSYARNAMANHLLKNKQFTHLLFVNDDISFDPELVLELLRFDKPVVGAISPRRGFDLHKFFASASGGGSFEQAQAAGAEFVLRRVSPPSDGWCQLSAIGMGITLIRREVFEEMAAKKAAPARTVPVTAGEILEGDVLHYGFFDHLFSEESKSLLSEDLSFCSRWCGCGGEIWGNASYDLSLLGQMVFKGNYLDSLEANANQAGQAP